MRKKPTKPPRSALADAPPEPQYPPNEDADYVDILWGILRHPVTCSCGRQTHTPYYREADRAPQCGRCYYEAHKLVSGTLWV